MVQLKEITDKSWLVMTDKSHENVGLLSVSNTGTFVLLSKEGRVSFADEEEVKRFFEEDVFDKVVHNEGGEEKEFFIKGYPVDFEHPYEADSEDKISSLPLYTKSPKSDVYHCAGYYCISYPKGWLQSFCPKLATLDKYEYVGPFKTKMEMKSQLSILKKNDRRNQKFQAEAKKHGTAEQA
jgi:hypothetical protein